MPNYTYYCRHCKSDFTLFKHISEDTEVDVCPRCERTCNQDFSVKGVAVHPDTLRNRVRLSSLYGCPVVESKTDRKKAMQAHDRKFGTKLVLD